MPTYHAMIRNFSPREIKILLLLPEGKSVLAHRIGTFPGCKARFKERIGLLDIKSVPESVGKQYKKWTT